MEGMVALKPDELANRFQAKLDIYRYMRDQCKGLHDYVSSGSLPASNAHVQGGLPKGCHAGEEAATVVGGSEESEGPKVQGAGKEEADGQCNGGPAGPLVSS